MNDLKNVAPQLGVRLNPVRSLLTPLPLHVHCVLTESFIVLHSSTSITASLNYLFYAISSTAAAPMGLV